MNQYHQIHGLTQILILSSHQRLGFTSDFFFQVFPTKHGMFFFCMCVRHGIGQYSKSYGMQTWGEDVIHGVKGWTVWGSNTDRSKRSFLRSFQTGSGVTQTRIQWVTGDLSLGLKWPGRQDDYPHPSRAEINNEWNSTSTPSVFLRAVYRDKFTCIGGMNLKHGVMAESRVTMLLLQSPF